MAALISRPTPTEAMPAVDLLLRFPGGVEELWTPVQDLLDSTPYDQAFVAEIDNQGQATLRFGDDEYGRRPTGVTGLRARWRIGNGSAGNLGAGALVHIVTPDPADPLDPANPGAPLVFADVAAIYQPLPARLGVDPQSIEEVRQLAPEAFRAIQFRAVTERDWQDAAMRNADVAAAKARFRWTGSWYTVFVAIQPRRSEQSCPAAGRGCGAGAGFRRCDRGLSDAISAGGLRAGGAGGGVCAARDRHHICASRATISAATSRPRCAACCPTRPMPTARGVSSIRSISASARRFICRGSMRRWRVWTGSNSASVTVFKRYWEVARDELARGLIAMGDMEIARLDNDPNFPENGVLRLSVIGGR